MSGIRPALTPEEWATLGPQGLGLPLPSLLADIEYLEEDDSKKAAAIALQGQSFGFTWDDVDLLRALAVWVHWEWKETQIEERTRSLADRIEALLPPREEA